VTLVSDFNQEPPDYERVCRFLQRMFRNKMVTGKEC